MQNVKELDEIIGAWIREHGLDEVVEILSKSSAVVGPMYDVAQLFEDPHYQFRQTFANIEDEELGNIRVPNDVAKFSRTPGKITSSGAKIGQHNEEIYLKMLGVTKEKYNELKAKRMI